MNIKIYSFHHLPPPPPPLPIIFFGGCGMSGRTPILDDHSHAFCFDNLSDVIYLVVLLLLLK